MTDPFGLPPGYSTMAAGFGLFRAWLLYLSRTPDRKQRWQVPFVVAFALLPVGVAVAVREAWLLAYVPFTAFGGVALVRSIGFCGRCGRTTLATERFCRACGSPLKEP